MIDNFTDLDGDAIKSAIRIARNLISLARESSSKGVDSEYAESLNSLATDMYESIMDAQIKTLASQEVQAEQANRIRELEQAVRDTDNWEAEKARYILVENDGLFVYKLREYTVGSGEPLHYICPRCYENRIKSILQGYGMGHYCLNCKGIFGNLQTS